jgi:NAD(P)-dependent dehydrogenase (short-subunit alcohol dehydrogenase family)
MLENFDLRTTPFSLAGMVAVVTGAAGGIGSAIALRLASLGANLALIDLKLEALAPLEAKLAELGVRSISIACNVADENAVAAAAQTVKKELLNCDILVNNAGILGQAKRIEELTLADWNRTMEVNLTSIFLCTREFGRLMLEKRRGSIVNLGSISAAAPNASPPYGVSKAAVLAFTRHTAVEWGVRGIRTNSISPGFIRTPLSESHYADPDVLTHRLSIVPLRRLGATDDIACAVAYLASDAAQFVNGQDITVDGGFMLTPLIHAQPKKDQYDARD